MRKIGLGEKIVVCITFFGLISTSSLKAQDDIEVNLSGDLVSSYVWRGVKQTGASMQPSLNTSYKGLTIASWASTDFGNNDGFKEVDFAASYEIKRFNITLTDYWWDGEGAANYFGGNSAGNGHMLEASLNYTLSNRFPLSLSWNTFFMGKGNKKENGENSYSTFIEASYPFAVKGINFDLALGVTPWKSVIYRTDKFSLTQIKLHASKTIKITDSFSVPVFADIIFNTDKHNEDVNFVFGITIN